MQKVILSVVLLYYCSFAGLYCQTTPVIRVNQVGYTPSAIKTAVLMSTSTASRETRFSLHTALTDSLVFTGDVRYSSVGWGRFSATARLNFSTFQTAGAYYVQCGSSRSPVFRIMPDVYHGAADFILRYMRQQRSGYNPVLNDSCHTQDGYIIYHGALDSTHIDVSGGWHDASDYLQYVTTSANAVYQLLFAYRQHPEVFTDAYSANGRSGANGIPDVLDEAKWGLDWLVKMNPNKELMFNQLADDRDHLGFRLPTLDTVSYGRGRERPVYFCTGTPQGVFKYKNRSTGIASTAGKYSSAFAAAAQILEPWYPEFSKTLRPKALEAYEKGKEYPGVCQTAPCRAPYFYEEDNWVDDMQLAAIELYRLHNNATFFDDAKKFGEQEPVTPWMINDTARHYQWYPFLNLGHVQIAALAGEHKSRFIEYLRRGIEAVWKRARTNAFLSGVSFIWCSNNLVVAMLTQARLYRQISGDAQYQEIEAAMRDWLFGCNPWGTSMIVGMPRVGITPRATHSAVALAGYSLDGALVDGPVQGSIYNALKGIKLTKADNFAAYQSEKAVYHDDPGDYSTNEPTMDGTASLAYILAALDSDGQKDFSPLKFTTKQHGGITRFDSTQRKIYLVFTGHEFLQGLPHIRQTLKNKGIKASFFFTGTVYRSKAAKSDVRGLQQDGHYLGTHSDEHLLYASWNNRDSLLISREKFMSDIRLNFAAIQPFGLTPDHSPYFLPPFEWYNDSISVWAAALGLRLINNTPGTLSQADYTYPELGIRYKTARQILERITNFERSSPTGLNGHILLLHAGTDPRRPQAERLYNHLDEIITTLRKGGYSFQRVGE